MPQSNPATTIPRLAVPKNQITFVWAGTMIPFTLCERTLSLSNVRQAYYLLKHTLSNARTTGLFIYPDRAATTCPLARLI